MLYSAALSIFVGNSLVLLLTSFSPLAVFGSAAAAVVSGFFFI
jgi:hypothetical protein